VYQNTIHTAFVGDSRLILATTKAFSAAEQPVRGDDKEVLDRLKRRRSVPAAMSLTSVQLTKDQKPEDPTEMERIVRMGGTVRRLMDESGHNVGPWRVWRKNGNAPGLAMSRSLGDTVGSEIGVISEPMVSTHVLRAGYDFFLVSATDGVWDVMENQEVADYVEAYRWTCRKEVNGLEAIDKARPDNSTIAQLLCEEARVRWLTIVEEEDVLIDDISCVVVELMESNLRLARPPGRVNAPNLDAADVPNSHASIKTSEAKVRDPRRGSVSEAAD
jgi:serine/threonine protein phosphatase PrpC